MEKSATEFPLSWIMETGDLPHFTSLVKDIFKHSVAKKYVLTVNVKVSELK